MQFLLLIRLCFLGVVFACFFLNTSLAQALPPPEIHGESITTGEVHRTGGAGDKASIRRGEFLTNEIKLNLAQMLKDDWIFDTKLRLRKTSDPKIDRRNNVHLLEYTSEIYDKNTHFTVGDFFGDFSQYTMSQSLDGVHAAYLTDAKDIKALAGYSLEEDETKAFKRYVTGLRYETLLAEDTGVFKDFRFGLNFSDVEDDQNSIKSKVNVVDASNQVLSLNSRVRLWDRTDVDGEIAQSWFSSSLYNSDTYFAREPNERKLGRAIRLKTTTKFSDGKNKLKLNYEAVDANFSTLAGSAVSDKVNIETRLDTKWRKDLTTELGYRLGYDKLLKSILDKRTFTHVPKFALNWLPNASEWLLRDFWGRFYWEMRKRVSQEDPSGQTDYTAHEWGLEDSFALGKYNFDSGFSIRHERDDLLKDNNLLAYQGHMGISRHALWWGKNVTPSLRWQMTDENNPKIYDRRLTNTGTLGLDTALSEQLLWEQKYSVTRLERSVADGDNLRFNGYMGFDYHFKSNRDRSLVLSYDYTSFGHELATESFNEQIIKLRFINKF